MRENELLVVTESVRIAGELGVLIKHQRRPGDILCVVRGPVQSEATRYSFSIGRRRHIEPTSSPSQPDFGRYINHFCDPTAFVRIAQDAHGAPCVEVVARMDLQAGAEVTFDYASLEYEGTVSEMKCQCGTAACRGMIQGFKDLPAALVARYRGGRHDRAVPIENARRLRHR
ncbi:MAG: SET domain-containing protein-lysine N-methyltransferase [Nitrococcus sp.]|nr:SET domain-containing protein-lysine N-methyltransferase [Nitrococcus sp.]